MRIRHYLGTHEILQAVLKIVVDEIRKTLIKCSPDIPKPRIGAISFIQHFGNTLNYHPHFHLIVADGIFNADETLQFHEAFLTEGDIVQTQNCIQKRVLGLFRKRGYFDKETVQTMLSYENSGFSLDAKVKIESWDIDGLERLIRYCARPPFKSENIRVHGPWINYHLPKRSHDGRTFIVVDPHDFLDRISRFVPYPRRHRHHFHGIIASGSPHRKQLAESAQKRLEAKAKAKQETVEKTKKVSQTWAKLIQRIYEVDPLLCPLCGSKIKIIAFVTHAAQIQRILCGIGWPTAVPEFDPYTEPEPVEVCDLVPGTLDGFPEIEVQVHYDTGPDPPSVQDIDPPHWKD